MFDLVLQHPKYDTSVPTFRRGFTASKVKSETIDYTPLFDPLPPPLVIEQSKLTHNGIIGYKHFENCGRKMHKNSLSNLLGLIGSGNTTLDFLVSEYKSSDSDESRIKVCNQAISLLNQEEWEKFISFTQQSRRLNNAQCRNVRKMSDKLAYYSGTRVFKSKKTGTYKMKVAFITLTAPESADPSQLLKAFNTFLDYLQRTANCYYVWKKELGETGKALHFHIMVNNFIPYYIVSWKWKRALLAQGVKFDLNDLAQETNAHTRIELPKNVKQTSHYISKYMSKAYELPGSYGYISGCSPILKQLKEIVVTPDLPEVADIAKMLKSEKVIKKDFVTFICVDLLKVKDKYPLLFSLFERQYLEFTQALTLPQKFNFV